MKWKSIMSQIAATNFVMDYIDGEYGVGEHRNYDIETIIKKAFRVEPDGSLELNVNDGFLCVIVEDNVL